MLGAAGPPAPGRVVLVDDRGPIALPVNFVVDQHTVLFRTDEGTKLDAARRGARVAFEIDGVNQAHRTGWSVVVRGEATQVTDPAELARLRQLPLSPWAPGAKGRYVRILPTLLTGRRIALPQGPWTWWGEGLRRWERHRARRSTSSTTPASSSGSGSACQRWAGCSSGPGFGVGPATLGAELELFLVDEMARPLWRNQAVRAAAADPRVNLELDRFDLELNASPTPLAGRPFAALGEERGGLLGDQRRAALPCAEQRPAALELASDDVALEGANPSFQVHLGVDPASLTRAYNAVQAATAPVLAVAGNSPTFVGQRLWEETRIALCKQSIDDRDGREPRRRLARLLANAAHTWPVGC